MSVPQMLPALNFTRTLLAFNFRFWDIFDFDVVGSTVNSSFQKESTSKIIEGLLAGIKFVVVS